MNPKELRAAFYARQSTKSQEHSVADQESVIRKKAKELGLTIVGSYTECASGATREERDALKRLLKDARKGEFKILIIYDMSRLSREGTFSSFSILNELKDYGVQVFDCKLDRLLKEQDSFLLCAEASQAQEESKKRARDVARGIGESVRTRKSDLGRKVYGFDRLYVDERGNPYQQVRLLPDGTKVILNPETKEEVSRLAKGVKYPKTKTHRTVLVNGDEKHVKIVERIFAYALQGVSATKIVNILNKEGVPGPRGGLWNASTVRSMLANPAYIGDIVYNKRGENRYCEITQDGQREKEGTDIGKKTVRHKPQKEWIIHEDAHEPIINGSDFDTIQKIRELRKRRGLGAPISNDIYLLSGITRCARCGAVMQGQKKSAGRNRKEFSYRRYVCSSSRKYGKSVCAHYGVNADALEKAALDRLQLWFMSLETRKKIISILELKLKYQLKTEEKIEHLQKEINKLLNKKSLLISNLNEKMIVFIEKDLNDIKDSIEEKQNKIDQLKNEKLPDYKTVIKQCMDSYDKIAKGIKVSCRATLRELLRDLGLNIVYDPDKKEVRLWFDPFVYGQLTRKSA